MNRIVAFGASSSKNSINKKLATWVAKQVENAEVQILDLNDFEMPIFSIDREKENGIPREAHDFRNVIKSADAVIISFAEHNGSFSSAYKNVTDWMSRIERGMWANKPILMLATSPGGRGAKTVLEHAVNIYPHRGAQVVGSFSLPFFKENFDENTGITDPALLQEFLKQKESLERTIGAFTE